MQRAAFPLALAIFAATWLLTVCSFWLVTGCGGFSGAGIMFYTIAAYFVGLPLAAFVSSILIGRVRELKHRRFAAPIAACVFYELAQLATAGIWREIEAAHLVDPLSAIAFGLIPSALGIAIGMLSTAAARKKSS